MPSVDGPDVNVEEDVGGKEIAGWDKKDDEDIRDLEAAVTAAREALLILGDTFFQNWSGSL